MRRIYYPVPVAASAYDDLVLSLKPKACWPLDETSGTVAHDITGNGYDGTISGGVTLGSTPPPMGGTSFGFPGSGKIATLYTPGALGAFTVVGWFYGNPLQGWAAVLWATNDVYHGGSGLMEVIGELTTGASSTGCYAETTAEGMQNATGATGDFPTDTWAMIVSRYSGSLSNIESLAVIDGASLSGIGQSSSGGAWGDCVSSGNPLLIAAPYGSDNYLDGNLAQIAFWEGRLTNSDLAKLWLAAVPNG